MSYNGSFFRYLIQICQFGQVWSFLPFCIIWLTDFFNIKKPAVLFNFCLMITFPTIFWYLERLNRPPRLSCIFRPQIYKEWEVLVRQKDETWLSLWPLAVKASQTLLVADGWWLVSWPNMHCRQHPVRICSFFLKNFSKHCQKMLKNISNKKKELHSFIHLVKWSDGNSVRSMVTREKATEIDIWGVWENRLFFFL